MTTMFFARPWRMKSAIPVRVMSPSKTACLCSNGSSFGTTDLDGNTASQMLRYQTQLQHSAGRKARTTHGVRRSHQRVPKAKRVVVVFRANQRDIQDEQIEAHKYHAAHNTCTVAHTSVGRKNDCWHGSGAPNTSVVTLSEQAALPMHADSTTERVDDEWHCEMS
jgi:hypothetical protein